MLENVYIIPVEGTLVLLSKPPLQPLTRDVVHCGLNCLSEDFCANPWTHWMGVDRASGAYDAYFS